MKVSIYKALNKVLANFNGILLADFWLVLNGSKNVTNRLDTTRSKLLFLLGIPLDGVEDRF